MDKQLKDARKWLTKNYPDVLLCGNENGATFVLNDIQCSITRDLFGVYSCDVQSNEYYDWLDIVNMYCLEEMDKVELKDVMKKTIKYLSRVKSKQDATITAAQHDESDSDYKIKLRYQKLAKSSKSIFALDGSTVRLFNSDTVADIIIDELICLKNWCKEHRGLNITVDIIDDNIYSWRVQFNRNTFTNENIKRALSDESASLAMELHFHNVYYPMYPPMIKIIGSKLDNSLAQRIANSKMVQTDYWTPIRNSTYLVERVKNIIEKFGMITTGEVVIEKKSEHVIRINGYLMKLASFVDIGRDDEIDEGEIYMKTSKLTKTKHTQHKTSQKASSKTTCGESKGWAAGTGYGTSNTEEWDPTELVKIQKEKDIQISSIVGAIIEEIYKSSHSDYSDIFNSIGCSLLIPYLCSQFKSANFLDMSGRDMLYRLYFSLLESFCLEEGVFLFGIKIGSETLHDVLNGLVKSANMALKFDADNEFANIVITICDAMINPLYQSYVIANSDKTCNDDNTVDTTSTSIVTGNTDTLNLKDHYVQVLSELTFDEAELYSSNFSDKYKTMYTSEKGSNWSSCIKRLSDEISSLSAPNALPIYYDSAIFLRVDESKHMMLRALITGPPDTPYDSGCFIFDIYMNNTYPNTSPNVWFINTGNNRLNPNLYADGKVCLSILGTYIGPRASGGEVWNNKTSSLLQVLISIQAQILIDTPYFNEPGREDIMGTSSGNSRSKAFNENIRLYTMKSTMCDLLESPHTYPQFTDVITAHFKNKKEYVLRTCKQWCDEASSINKDKYNELYDRIKSRIDAL
jgi:ubiquitin-protein ligase